MADSGSHLHAGTGEGLQTARLPRLAVRAFSAGGTGICSSLRNTPSARQTRGSSWQGVREAGCWAGSSSEINLE